MSPHHHHHLIPRGLEKNGGRLLLRSHVDQIVVEGGRATGVRLKGGDIIRCRRIMFSSQHKQPVSMYSNSETSQGIPIMVI